MTKLVTVEQISEIKDALHNNCIVAFPTDTVYGIGVLCSSDTAYEKMKYAKKRPETKPFPVMVANLQQLEEVAYINERERKIITQLTPGALTLILKNKSIHNGLETVAIRIPDDKFVLDLISEVGPMYVTSANISGEPACNTDKEVLEQLDGRIDYIVKGEAYSKVASTIIDCTADNLKVLREGQISLEEIEKVIQ